MTTTLGSRPECSDGLTAYPTAEELARLARRARENGIRIVGPSTRPHAWDPTTGRTYALTLVSCTCRMFFVAGGCQHHALLVAERTPAAAA